MFAKIFASIFDSSIAEDWQTRVVFQDMLVLADKNGILDMTPASIARRTNIPLEMVTDAIPKLEAPDPSSRTEANEGRRIVRLDAHRAWGWQIVNFIKYRESASKEMLRMAEADRKRAYRSKFGKPSPPIPPTPEQKQKQREKQNSPGSVPELSRTPSLESLQEWQLRKDLEGINEEINQERSKAEPDTDRINYLLSQRSDIKAEQSRRGKARRGKALPATKERDNADKIVLDALTKRIAAASEASEEMSRMMGNDGKPLTKREAEQRIEQAKREAGLIQ
jgi:hypothetical protein